MGFILALIVKHVRLMSWLIFAQLTDLHLPPETHIIGKLTLIWCPLTSTSESCAYASSPKIIKYM